tara:strand:+ start:28 stop:438 length:411 start_codon:yes stop_codon:yes gene_type:complete
MDYTITDNEMFPAKPSFFERMSSIFSTTSSNRKHSLDAQIDGLRADYAMALDNCQMMKQHIQDLENKLDNMTATMNLRPEIKDSETPYSTAIVLAKRGCDKQEIQDACGITDSEVELILTLHNKVYGHTSDSVLAN